MNCQAIDDLLLEFVEGELEKPQAEDVRTHLRTCPACHAKLRDYRELFGDLSAARSLDNRLNRPEAQVSTNAAPAHSHRGLHRIGDFEIITELGRGGMGVVYRAQQVSLGREVALKVLAAGAVQTQRAIQRFRHEAQAAARLHHTNIVPVYAQGESDGCCYYAMELIDGRPLHIVIRDDPDLGEAENLGHSADAANTAIDARKPTVDSAAASRAAASRRATVRLDRPAASAAPAGGSQSALARISGSFWRPRSAPRRFKRIARLFAEAAEALEHAHQQNILHRDIKPQNLLLGRDDKLHITDFGLARLMDEPGLTMTSEMVGTPAYMSREQITGPSSLVDARTDVYSLGVTLYEALTRQRAFEGQTYEKVIQAVLHDEPRRPRRIDSAIPIDLETICLRAMDKERERRFLSAGAMAADLRRYATDYPIASRRVGPLARASRWVKRNKAKTTAIAAILVAATLGPLLYHTAKANANQHLAQAWNTLLDDYRQTGTAMSELSAAGWLGDPRRKLLIRALAVVSDEPEQTRALLGPWVERHPDDRAALALLAWANMWTVPEQGQPRFDLSMEQIREVMRLSAEGSDGSAEFFIGQALMEVDYDEASSAFRRAIDLRYPQRFPQAMLHRARVLNNALYAHRNRIYYFDAASAFSSLAELLPKDPYPPYLRSVTQKLYAEILLAEQRDSGHSGVADADSRDTADDAYDKGLKNAEDATARDPLRGFGQLGEAGIHESRGIWAQSAEDRREHLLLAAHAYRAIPDEAMRNNPRIFRAQKFYSMRVAFWLNDCNAAETWRSMRYANEIDKEVDQFVYQAAFARCRGDDAAGRAAVNEGISVAGRLIHQRVRLWGSAPFLGLANAVAFSDSTDIESRRPEFWSAAFAQALDDYMNDLGSWEQLEAASVADKPEANRIHRRQAAMRYLRAAREMRAGRRDEAMKWLQLAADSYDHEQFCYMARVWLERMETDATWPPPELPK